MSAEIISLPTKPRNGDYIFVCNCGSSTFSLRGDATIECTVCRAPISSEDHFSWYDTAKNAHDAPDDTPAPVISRGGNDGEFAERLAKKNVLEADWIIHGTHDGSVSSWQREYLETDEQREWMRRGVTTGLDMLLKERE